MKSLFFIASLLCAVMVSDYSGSWKYTVDSPEGKVSGTFVLTKTADGYTGSATSDAGVTDLENLVVDGDAISFHVYYQGYKVKVKGKFNDDKMETMVDVEGMQFPLVAEKVLD